MSPPAEPLHPLPRKDAFFGLHFDLHPQKHDTALGAAAHGGRQAEPAPAEPGERAAGLRPAKSRDIRGDEPPGHGPRGTRIDGTKCPTDFVPSVGPITVRLGVPHEPQKVSWMPGRDELDWTWREGQLSAAIPALHIHGALVVD